MYEQFTDYVHKVMPMANSEAKRFNHETIGTEHTLLALTKLGKGGAVHVLRKLDVDVKNVCREIENTMKRGPSEEFTMGKLPLTPGMKNVMEYAMEEARNLNHPYVGTHHLLLGLLREQEGVAALRNTLGVTLEDARAEVSQMSEEGERPFISPSGPDHDIRHAIKSIWLGPFEKLVSEFSVEYSNIF